MTEDRAAQEPDEPGEASAFDRAEIVHEAGEVEREHRREVLEVEGMAEYLAPEVERGLPAERAAEAVAEFAEGDEDLIEEAEVVARREHHEAPAELLHDAAEEATEDG
jgi:hypothetical protein